MYDYDVGAVGLVTPPASAVVTPYRPAVSVRNNGVHDALAAGYVRIYAAGLLIFQTEVYSGIITPGHTGLALGTASWTPPAEGTYMIFGYVSCPLDQFEPNNNLAPLTITVAGGPVPPPTPVVPHAPQHEEGGSDEVNIDGLRGRTADQQSPLPHVADHQAGGSDALNLGGLLGQAAQDQPTLTHSNSKHDPTFATSSQMSQHQAATTVHTTATNLANRETTGNQTGLVKATQLADQSEVAEEGEDPERWALLRETQEVPPTGRRWGKPWPTPHASSHAPGSTDALKGTPLHMICIWDSTDPAPDGWDQEPLPIQLPPPYIYIKYNRA